MVARLVLYCTWHTSVSLFHCQNTGLGHYEFMCENTIHIKTTCPLIFFLLVSAFWFDVMNAWLNLVKASIRTRMFSLPSFEGSTFVKSTHNQIHWGILLLLYPVLFLDLHNHLCCLATCEQFSHNWYDILEHGIPLKSLLAEGKSMFYPLMSLVIM